ncbi:MAG: glycosyltransferase family 9 protein [Verrucomicrobia bacterium]|jgi:ADP-heptose:LPS heptosyltransferase|nr:glycosyltransferase family 9 protein [Verrucomicrobiota bacterium]MBT7066667.1 glycosyltransferase family 9 protein [Verrucomicrobiota bacterium]MBT7701602.1 glycosyltransferase family 9 protein [Verrucomicrobiota bacterium]
MNSGSVLVVYSGWLGDLVWIFPAIRALGSAFESVSLVVSKTQAPLAEVLKNGVVDHLYVDDSSRRLATAKQVRQDARARGTRTFIDLKGRGKTGLYIPWGRGNTVMIPHKSDAREYVFARLLHPLAASLPARSTGHMVDAYLSGLSGLGIENVPVSFDLPFDDATVAAGEAIVEREGLRERKSIALNIGSAQFSKIWPAENYRRLAEILEQDLDCKVVIMGSRDFSPNGDYDMQQSQEIFSTTPFTNLIEETSLPVDAYLLSSGGFNVVVGNDSFAGHMAGSASQVGAGTEGAVQADNGRWYKGNPTVSLFGPTNPLYCRPYDPTDSFNTVVMPETYPDACVYDHVAHTCPHYGDRYCVDRAHCMAELKVEQVVAAIEQKLPGGR